MLVSKLFTNGPAGTLYAAQESEEVPEVDGLIVPEGHVTAVGADGRGRIRTSASPFYACRQGPSRHDSNQW